MTKTEFITAIATKTGGTKAEADAHWKAIEEVIIETLVAGNSVDITGFGKFESARSEAREGRNPQTGDVIQIPAKNNPKFRPGSRLKDALNV